MLLSRVSWSRAMRVQMADPRPRGAERDLVSGISTAAPGGVATSSGRILVIFLIFWRSNASSPDRWARLTSTEALGLRIVGGGTLHIP